MQDLDLPVLLLESQRLAVLRYDTGLHRLAICNLQFQSTIMCKGLKIINAGRSDHGFMCLTGRFANMISVDLQAAGFGTHPAYPVAQLNILAFSQSSLRVLKVCRAGLPRFLHGSILEVHERSKTVALATGQRHITVFRGGQAFQHSFSGPRTYHFPRFDEAYEPPQSLDSMVVKDVCFAGWQPHTLHLLFCC